MCHRDILLSISLSWLHCWSVHPAHLTLLFLPPHVLLLSCVHLIGEGSWCLHNNSFRTFHAQFPSIPSCKCFLLAGHKCHWGHKLHILWKGQRLSQLKPSACLGSRVLQFVYQPWFNLEHCGEIAITPANIQAHYMIIWRVCAELLMSLLLYL